MSIIQLFLHISCFDLCQLRYLIEVLSPFTMHQWIVNVCFESLDHPTINRFWQCMEVPKKTLKKVRQRNEIKYSIVSHVRTSMSKYILPFGVLLSFYNVQISSNMFILHKKWIYRRLSVVYYPSDIKYKVSIKFL